MIPSRPIVVDPGSDSGGGSPQGGGPQGTSPHGTGPQGTSPQGTSPQGTSPIDRLGYGQVDGDGFIGPYRLLSVIGEGGIGIVFKAEHGTTGQIVALKTVRRQREGHLASFRREFHTVRQIQHPRIVRILDGDTVHGRPWYAMELLTGQTLGERFRGHKGTDDGSWITGDVDTADDVPTVRATTDHPGDFPGSAVMPRRPRKPLLPLHDLLTILRKVADALTFIHGQGVVHRDLKPGNIFIRSDGEPVLMDFGLVHRYARGAREVLDIAGRRDGTTGYIAPEQLRGERVDARADLYALGCILYEGLTGTLPLPSTGSRGPGRQRELIDAVAARATRPDLPSALEDLILKLLADRAADRLGHASDVARILEKLGAQPRDAAEMDTPRGYLYRPQFSGRETAVAKLDVAVSQVRGGEGGLVLVTGESGIGKTSVLIELARTATALGLAVITSECLPLSGIASADSQATTPLQAFARVLEAVADRCRAGGPSETERLLGERTAVLGAYHQAISDIQPHKDDSGPRHFPDGLGRARVFGALAETLTALTAERPLIIVIDDLQWSDELSLRFLSWLRPDFFRKTPLLIVAGSRSESLRPEVAALQELPHVQALPLSRLGDQAIGSMARDMLAVSHPPAALLDFLTAISLGNPFFVAEYLRAAVYERLLVRDADGHWRVSDPSGFESLPLPRSVGQLVQRRLEKIGADARLFLDVAAVMGRETNLTATASVLDWSDEGRLQSALGELIEGQILEESADDEFRFLHDRLREFVYGAMDPAARQAIHRRAADTLESTLRDSPEWSRVWSSLGYHFAGAGLAERAAEYFIRAADHARARFANADAISLYQQAAKQLEALATTTPSRKAAGDTARVNESLADLLSLGARREDARIIYGSILAEAGDDPPTAARIERKRGKTWELDRAYAPALESYAAAEAILEREAQRDAPWWREWLDIQIDRTWAYYWTGKLPEMEETINRIDDAADRYGSAAQRAHYYLSFALLGARKERYRLSSGTVSHARLARGAALESGDFAQITMGRFGYAFSLLFRGELAEAQAEMILAVNEAKKTGDHAAHVRALAYLMILCRRRNEPSQVESLASETIALAESSQMKDYFGAARACQGWLLHRHGRLGEAEVLLNEALAAWRQPPAIYPFQGLALFPLLSLHGQRADVDACMTTVAALLHETQERLPPELEQRLQEAQGAQDGSALARVNAALLLAIRHGYL